MLRLGVSLSAHFHLIQLVMLNWEGRDKTASCHFTLDYSEFGVSHSQQLTVALMRRECVLTLADLAVSIGEAETSVSSFASIFETRGLSASANTSLSDPELEQTQKKQQQVNRSKLSQSTSKQTSTRGHLF